MRRPIVLLASTGVLALTLSACAADAPGSPETRTPSPTPTASVPHTPTPPRPVALSWPAGTADEPKQLATGLAAPWSIAFTDDAALVSERDTARILELAPGGATRDVGTVAGVAHGGEGGLLGIAVRDGSLYAYSTAADGSRIQRFPLQGAAGSYALGEPQDLLTGIPSARTHNGGRLAFGPDGMLYASTGDAGDRPSAQDRESLGGKILRLAPDGSVPADNPFGNAVWTLGHRNVQGLAWASDGTMYATEFGQDAWDELNVITPGSNYGWPEVEGTDGQDDSRFTAPVRTWATDEASPSGLTFADGALYLAALRGEQLIRVSAQSSEAMPSLWSDRFGRLRDVTVAPDGTVFVLTNNTDGRGDPRDGDDRTLTFRP